MQSSHAPFWIVIGDLHGRTDRLSAIPGTASAEGILITGDLTTAGGAAAARHVLDSVAAFNPMTLALFGNMDKPGVAACLREAGIDLHRTVRQLDAATAVLGIGGSTPTPFGTPSEFSEADIARWLDELLPQARNSSRLVLVSHTPPLGTACDRTAGGLHVGSEAVREFIVKHQPDVCLCGHIHESCAEDRLGRTRVVNPGALGDGGYAVLSLGATLEVSRHVAGN